MQIQLPTQRSLKQRILWHSLFWIWLYATDVFIFGVAYNNIDLFKSLALLEMPGQLFFAYLFIYWLLPRHLRRNNYIESVAWVIFFFLITGFITQTLFLIFPAPGTTEIFWDPPKIMMRAFYCILKACIFIVLKLTMTWYENQKAVVELERSRTASELKMLKDQVNPHFMFNTLNNLYGLIGKNPIHAQESVMGLSGIFRYMLYETNQKFVPLKREIKCIEDYIALEKLRYANILSVSVNIDPKVNELSIVPLVLFPFVENSFKHGASELIRDAWINVDMAIFKEEFIFKIENSKQNYLESERRGIGLANVKRRLELTYGDNHKLQLIEQGDQYLVVLKIALKEMQAQTVEIYEDEVSYRGR
jgi:two-component system, LytTR family, sensor kinase